MYNKELARINSLNFLVSVVSLSLSYVVDVTRENKNSMKDCQQKVQIMYTLSTTLTVHSMNCM